MGVHANRRQPIADGNLTLGANSQLKGAGVVCLPQT